MAITRRTSAAYSSFIAITTMQNNTAQDGKHSRGSIGWYENDQNIINRSNQNPFSDYPRHGRRSTEISELPKIFVEGDDQDINQSLTSDTKEDLIKPTDLNDEEPEEIIDCGANLIEINPIVTNSATNDTTSCMLYENPLSDEFSDVFNKSPYKIPFDLCDHQNKLKRRWSVSNLSYECDKSGFNNRMPSSEQNCLPNHHDHPLHHQSITKDVNTTNWNGMSNEKHRRLTRNCNSNPSDFVGNKEKSSNCLKKLCSLPDYQHSSPNSESITLLSQGDSYEKERMSNSEHVLLFSSSKGNTDDEINKTKLDNCKEKMFQHSRTIQSIFEKSGSPIKLPSQQNKSLPDIGIFAILELSFKLPDQIITSSLKR